MERAVDMHAPRQHEDEREKACQSEQAPPCRHVPPFLDERTVRAHTNQCSDSLLGPSPAASIALRQAGENHRSWMVVALGYTALGAAAALAAEWSRGHGARHCGIGRRSVGADNG